MDSSQNAQVLDAGGGPTGVTLPGGANRELRMPVADSGMAGVAGLYHAVWMVDLSYAAWDGTGDDIKGGSLPRPDLLASHLAEGASAVQPRPGTMPGLYVYYDNQNETFYQYGGPIDSGASPGSTAIYSDPSPVGEGFGPSGTTWRRSNLSGAQLWHYASASPAYLEIKHIDGTVARLDNFNPYATTFTPGGALWRVTSVRDPYDNVATYHYDTAHRLTSIHFPSGLNQHFDYTPSWNHGSGYSCLEVRYTQTTAGTTTALPQRTWGVVFSTPGPTQGTHFGARLFRTYAASRAILKDQASAGVPHTITSSSSVTGQVVHDFAYTADATVRMVTETQAVHVGTPFAATLSHDPDLDPYAICQTKFSLGTDRRTIALNNPLLSRSVAITFGAGARTTDLADLPIGTTLAATTVTSTVGSSTDTKTFEYYAPAGRVYSVIHTPSNDSYGRPRANSTGVGGVSGTEVEPESITSYRIYDGTCVCNKPIEVRTIAVRGGSSHTRVSKYTYDPLTKLVLTHTEPNPATTPGSQPAELTWTYTYTQSKASGQLWGAWLPATEVTPDGTYSYTYGDLMNRSDAVQHGQIAGTVTRTLASVRIQGSLTDGTSSTSAAVAETVYRNLLNSPGGYSWLGTVSGQTRASIDGDGVLTTYEYATTGWLDSLVSHGGATKTTFGRDAAGNVTTVTENSGGGSLSLLTTFTALSPFGVPGGSSSTSGGLLRQTESWFDRFGHLAVSRANNLASDGSAPKQYLASSSSARGWIESQDIYLHDRLIETYRDRKPSDEAAGGAQFLRTLYHYHTDGRLQKLTHPSGSTTDYTFDGYGSLFKTVKSNPAGSSSVESARRYCNPFLEVTAVYENTGTDALWTSIDRNAAGAIIKITEPSTTAPSGYTGSTGGAVHEFEIDVMGRVVEARGKEGSTLLTKREVRYDQLSRQIWQRDHVLGFGSGDRHQAWRYQAGKASQLLNTEVTGIGLSTYTYDATKGFLLSTLDAAGNAVEYTYHTHTTYLASVTKKDVDPLGGLRQTETAYDVNPYGDVTAIHIGGSSPLTHQYAYDSLRRVDRYTDPAGLVQRFLPDGLGRIVEHVRVAASGYIHNAATFDEYEADGRTKESRFDGRGNVTVTHWDFAGRPFIVQNPGGDVAPTSSVKNRSMCLYAEYDGASRIAAVYDGDGGKTAFFRDGPGRVIQRELAVLAPNIAQWNTRDVIRRDALGRITTTNLWGSTATGTTPDHGFAVALEQFDVDSLNRTHAERFQYALAPANMVTVQSTFGAGNLQRQGLSYTDGSNPALSMSYGHDTIGRLTDLGWNAGAATLASYTWVGGFRRGRTVKYGTAGNDYPQGQTNFSYDAYDRLLGIESKVYTAAGTFTTPSKFDYEYDLASNLKKEKYTKHDGSFGDRFAYDDFQRLSKAWMGVSSAAMSATPDPTGFVASDMHEYLTYGLDAANNRTTTGAVNATSSTTSNYTVQGASHPQGASNRYDTVGPAGAGATLEYDERGNLRFDGRFYYRYDFLNRLQEVWEVVPESPPPDGKPVEVVDEDALKDSKEDVELSIPDLMQRLPREHMDPTFRARLRGTLSGGVLQWVQQGSNSAQQVSQADMQLVAVYGYDAFNRRILSVVVGVETSFHAWDGWRQTQQCAPNWSNFTAVATKQFVWGSRLDELVSYRRLVGTAWQNFFVLPGGQDTSAKLVDAAGAVVEEYEYDPYGAVTVWTWSGSAWVKSGQSQYGLPFLWKSIRLDAETGLLYMRNRYYSTELGRFLTRDPIGVWGDRLNWGNEVGYASERPLSIGDAMGLQADAYPIGFVPVDGRLMIFYGDGRSSYANEVNGGGLAPWPAILVKQYSDRDVKHPDPKLAASGVVGRRAVVAWNVTDVRPCQEIRTYVKGTMKYVKDGREWDMDGPGGTPFRSEFEEDIGVDAKQGYVRQGYRFPSVSPLASGFFEVGPPIDGAPPPMRFPSELKAVRRDDTGSLWAYVDQPGVKNNSKFQGVIVMRLTFRVDVVDPCTGFVFSRRETQVDREWSFDGGNVTGGMPKKDGR